MLEKILDFLESTTGKICLFVLLTIIIFVCYGLPNIHNYSSMNQFEDLDAVTGEALAVNETEEPVSEQAIGVEEDANAEDSFSLLNECTFTKEDKNNLETFMKNNSRVKLKIEHLTRADELEVRNYTDVIDVDAKNNNVRWDRTKYAYNDNKGTTEERFINYTKDWHFINKSDKWVEETGKSEVLDWNVTTFKNSLDVFKFIIGDNKIELNSTGEIFDYNCYQYTITKKAEKSDVYGIVYDELGNKNITYELIQDGNGLCPISVTIDVEIYKEGVKYDTLSIITFESFSNKKLKLPKGAKGVD